MNKQNSSLLPIISTHALAWIGLFSMPHLMAYITNSPPPPNGLYIIIMPLQLVGVFYINYLWLINKYLFKRKVRVFLFVNILLLGISTIAVTYFHQVILTSTRPPSPFDHENRLINLPTVMNMLIQLLIIGMSVAIKMTGQWYEARQRVQELEKVNAEAELQQLRAQLNPHFLFNSLNNIYALISFNPDKAQLSLTSLCDMLRYQLYEANRETIPLEKEVAFVRSYCDLMRIRLPQHVELTVNIPDVHHRVHIAPLLFVSIVENAFKHGVSQKDPSHIHINLHVEGSTVMCEARNSYFPKRHNDQSGSGIGIDNLQRRLNLLYPLAHSFSAKRIENEFVTQLIIKTTA